MNSNCWVITQKLKHLKQKYICEDWVSKLDSKIEFFVLYNRHQNCLDNSLMVYHVSNRFLKKNLEFIWSLGIFTFLRVLAPSWQHFGCHTLFVSAEPSQTILSIDRSEPRFESHTGAKITKTLKNDENFNGFC